MKKLTKLFAKSKKKNILSRLLSKSKQKKTANKAQLGTWSGFLSTILVVICPACSVLWAGVFSTLGLAAIIPFWEPIVLGLMLLAFGGFYINYLRHRDIRPIALLLIGDVLLYVGKYALLLSWMWIFGAILIVVAVILNYLICKGLPCKINLVKSRVENQDIYKHTTFVLIGIIIGYFAFQLNILAPMGVTREAPARVAQTQVTPTPGRQIRLESGIDAEGRHYLGSLNATVVLEEFSDFQCPFCQRFFAQTMPQLKQNYIATGKVKFVYRHFPLLSIHPAALPAAEAAECAGEQGKFWEFHDIIFMNVDAWSKSSDTAIYKQMAQALKLDVNKFASCIDSGKMKQKVMADLAEGEARGVRATPTVFVNDGKIEGAQPYANFSSLIDQLLNK